MADTIESVLAKYLPPETVRECADWIVHKNIHLRITGMRASKLGDYRPHPKGNGHQITVNHDLNPYAFLITFTHEVAHLVCYERYGHRHEPHGREWKHHFRELLLPFLDRGIFPADLSQSVYAYLRDPGASSCSDPGLMRALRRHDKPGDQPIAHLEDLPEGALFRLAGHRSRLRFEKGPRMRSRFRCLEISSGKEYLVSAIAEVLPLSDPAGEGPAIR
jgi:hypothetical protein